MLMGVSTMKYYIPAYLAVLATGILYAISLIFSIARKRKWLQTSGLITFILGMILISAVIWNMQPANVHKSATLEKIHQWASLIGCIVPVLFIMNFWSERKALKEVKVDSPAHPEQSLESIMYFIGLVAVVLTFIFASTVASETSSKLIWKTQLAIQAKAWAKIFESRTYVSTKGDTLHYQLLKPLDYSPHKKYPLVVCLPYGGGVEGCPPAQMLLSDLNRRKYPSFLFVPYCPEGSGWGGVPNHPTIDSLAFESIYALEQEFKEIDVKRRYVTGVSRGGYGSWHFISTRPEMFAAAIPVCGGGDPHLAKDIVDVSVWAFHGEKDKNVPVKESRDMIDAIKKAGGDPRYKEFANEGHGIWDKVMATPGLLDWLFDQQRDND